MSIEMLWGLTKDVSNLDVWPILPPFRYLLEALEIFGFPSLP